MEKSSYLSLSGQSLVIRDTQFTDLKVQTVPKTLLVFIYLFLYGNCSAPAEHWLHQNQTYKEIINSFINLYITIIFYISNEHFSFKKNRLFQSYLDLQMKSTQYL